MADVADARSPSHAKRPVGYWLWMLVVAMAAITLSVAIGNVLSPAGKALSRDSFGQDFLAFYSAGTVALDGNPHELYDAAALSQWQDDIANEAGLARVSALAPWWNPPHFALLFAPLSKLSYHAALGAWLGASVAFLVGAAVILTGIVREASTRRRDWMLVPALLAIAPPTLQSIGHGQNGTLSLLLLSAAVIAWRAGRPLCAGVACSLLFYKPQLASLVALAMVGTLGWRVVVGLMIGLVPQMLATVTLLPDALTDFLDRVPESVRQFQAMHPELLHRHTTIGSFFRFTFGPDAIGGTPSWIAGLSAIAVTVVLGTVARAWWTMRPAIADGDGLSLDRLITLVLLATPLVMPYFGDYDLLLLGVAGVLIARDLLETGERTTIARWLTCTGIATFAWLLFNPVLAPTIGVNLTVPLLGALFGLHARRCIADDGEAATITLPQAKAPASRLAA